MDKLQPRAYEVSRRMKFLQLSLIAALIYWIMIATPPSDKMNEEKEEDYDPYEAKERAERWFRHLQACDSD